jgi:hypothetical protein
MPTVPRYSEQKVQQAGFPGVRLDTQAPIAAFGGGQTNAAVHESIGRFTDTTSKILIEEKKNADSLAVQDAYLKTVQLKNKLFWDPKEGAMNRRGKDALGANEEYISRFNQDSDEIYQSLSNDDQRKAYELRRAELRNDLDGNLQRHTFTEIQKFDEESTKSGLDVLRDEAIFNYGNPTKVQRTIEAQKGIVLDHAKRYGRSPEWVEENLKEAESKTHMGVLQRMIDNGEDLRAKAYYGQIKGGLKGADASKAERVLEEGSLLGESQRWTDKIMKTAASEQEARNMIKDSLSHDPKLRKSVDEMVRSEFSIQNRLADQENASNFIEAANLLEKNKTMSAVPPSLRATLKPGQRTALHLLEQQMNGVTAVNHDEATFLKYYGMDEGALADVSEVDLITKVRPYVESSKYNKVTTRWQLAKKGRRGDSKALAEAKSMYTDEELVFDVLKNSDIETFKTVPTFKDAAKNKKAEASYQSFRRQVDNEWISFHKDHGRQPNGQEKRDIANRLLIKRVFVDENFIQKDPQLPVNALTPEQRSKAYVPITEIPESDRKQFINLIRARRGLTTASDKEILKTHGRKIERAYGLFMMGGNEAKAEAHKILSGD